ncbi:MAG: 50S ribosomal protein L4 [Actinobacteria bacterium]|nr:50S ribosomal protein L4 [Actinomycetota bacterium]
MPTVDLIDVKGKKSGSVDLPEALFDATTNVPLIHQVVVAQLAAARQGTQSTLRRGEVSGTGKKPFKQKGTGRARQGSIRMPQHRGGGIVHGPKPRSYDQRTPKKMVVAALRGALSDRARNGKIHVIDQFGIKDTPSTKAAGAFLSSISSAKNVLVVLHRDDEVSYLSLRNLPEVHVLPVDQLNAYDVLHAEDIVFTSAALASYVESACNRGGQRMSNLNKDPRDVIVKPIISEKSYALIDEGKYTFEVDPRSNKTEIKQAVEQIFNVKVDTINTLNRQGKTRRTRFGMGKRKDTKRAIVTLKSGSIDIFTYIG